MDSNLKDALKEIIKDTFKTIDTIYNNRYGEITDNNRSRLIFPCYSSQNKSKSSEGQRARIKVFIYRNFL